MNVNHCTPLFAILYARLSPRPNGKDSESIELQIDKMRKWCACYGYTIIGEPFVDREISGRSMDNREGLKQAVQLAKREGATLLFYSLSRLARNARDAFNLEYDLRASGARMASVYDGFDTTTARGRINFRHTACAAEDEVDILSERTSIGMLENQANGRRQSRYAPYGFEIDPDSPLKPERKITKGQEPRMLPSRIRPCDREAELAKIVARKHGEGMSQSQIAKWLNSENIPFREAPWSYHSVRLALEFAGNGA